MHRKREEKEKREKRKEKNITKKFGTLHAHDKLMEVVRRDGWCSSLD